jgi:hypothetical protein
MKGQTRLPRTKKGTPPPYRHHSSGQVVITLPDWFGGPKDFPFGPHGTRTSREEYSLFLVGWEAHGRRLPRPARLTDFTR